VICEMSSGGMKLGWSARTSLEVSILPDVERLEYLGSMELDSLL
jgi:hypothetical protein